MADLKSVTVQYLRQLARKHLGRGHSKLKTRKDLLAALVHRVPALVKLLGLEEEGAVRGTRKAPATVSAASRTGKPGDGPPGPRKPSIVDRPLPVAEDDDDDEKTPVRDPTRPAKVVNFPPKPKPRPHPPDPGPVAGDPPPSTSTPSGTEAQHAAEPLVEGFFVARVAGEGEAFRHHLTEEQSPPPHETTLGSPDYDERLGQLPAEYADDTMLLLPRDPHTLFVLWDFSPEARQRALEGLESPRAVLRVYDDQDVLFRVIDVALESRCYYIHGLAPGRPYRAEAHFVSSTGRSRRIGHSSNRVFLPPVGPSQDTSVRFVRMPPLTARRESVEALAATAPTRNAELEEREYITWRRVPLPGSAGFEDVAERHRERVPAPQGEGASALPYWLVGRPGSSEQWAWSRQQQALGSSEQWSWPVFSPPGGSSEQGPLPPRPPEEWNWTRPGAPGSSEQRVWSHPGADASSEQRGWPHPGAGGASEQGAWFRSGMGGASEQGAWSRPGIGGSSEQRDGSRPGAGGALEQWAWVYQPHTGGPPELRLWSRPAEVRVTPEHWPSGGQGSASEQWAWSSPSSSGMGR